MYCAVMFLPGRIFRASLLVTRLPSDKGVGAQVSMCHHVSSCVVCRYPDSGQAQAQAQDEY